MQSSWTVLGLPLALAVLLLASPAHSAGEPVRPVSEILANLKVPPDWLAATPVNWDTSKPWKDARLEIRRLLALDDASVRQGVKLTWLYAQKADIGDGHELPMYLFLSGNYGWALKEYPPYLERQRGKGATHGFLCYASCLAHFGDYQAALTALNQALSDLPPKPWRTASEANIHNQTGDVYGRMGNLAKAREQYAEAVRLYPLSDQPYGRHLLPRKIAQIQAKERLLTLESLGTAKLRDGAYTGNATGYSDKNDLVVTLTIKAGRLAGLEVRHEEKIDLNATKIIPKRILEKQSLKVDAVTGATVTSQAIIEGAYRALLKAGLK
jgi:uncharacterized protein with FMN-binding domain